MSDREIQLNRVDPSVIEKMPGLGRVHLPDPRDNLFRMAAPPRSAIRQTFRNWLVPGGAYDQGDTSMCVAYSVEAWLRAHPIVNAHREEYEVDIPELYVESQRNDEWPGENYDGTTVRAAFKVLQRRGFVSSYSWAPNADVLARHVLTTGPAVVGTWWTLDMFTPDRHEYIYPTGAVVGGHAYLITGVNLRRENSDGTIGAFRMQNSWGPNWSDDGRAWITYDMLDLLLRYDGEACAAQETRLRDD